MTTSQLGRSQNEHILALAEELLADIELGQVEPQGVVLKALRLARLSGLDSVSKWLDLEILGYDRGTDPEVVRQWAVATGRWDGNSEQTWTPQPLAELNAATGAAQLQMQSLRIPDVGDFSGAARITIENIIRTESTLRNAVAQYTGIRSRVLGLVHQFATSIYHERMFSGVAESIFERYKREVDTLLAIDCGDVLERIPSIYDRLAEGDREAVSAALNSCRRILSAFADVVYPPSDTPVVRDGNTTLVKRMNYVNRIDEYVRQVEPSDKRRARLRKTLTGINDRASAGVHDDVTVEEAQALFLNTYMAIGEIARIGGGPPQRIPAVEPAAGPPAALDE